MFEGLFDKKGTTSLQKDISPERKNMFEGIWDLPRFERPGTIKPVEPEPPKPKSLWERVKGAFSWERKPVTEPPTLPWMPKPPEREPLPLAPESLKDTFLYYPEWERLEEEGKMTPALEAMKKAGFGPPIKREPLTPTEKYIHQELGMPRAELGPMSPEDSFIRFPALKEEMNMIGRKEFEKKYPEEITYSVSKAITEEEKYREGGVLYGGHDKVPAEEWIRKGLSFNHGPGLPIETATTPKEVALQTAGWVLGATLFRYIANPLVGGILSKVPGAAQPIAKLTAGATRHPWKVGWPLEIIKSGGWGAVLGAIEKPENKEQWLRQIGIRAGTFAAFAAIAYPLQMFFRPVIYSIGKDIKMGPNPEVKQMLGTKGMQTIYTMPEPVWFKHPTDPKVILKVTNARIDVLPFASAPPSAKPYPIFGGREVEAFHYDPSLYSKLKDFLKGVEFSTPISPPPPGAPAGMLPTTNIAPPGVAPAAPSAVPVPPTVAEKVGKEITNLQILRRQIEEAGFPEEVKKDFLDRLMKREAGLHKQYTEAEPAITPPAPKAVVPTEKPIVTPAPKPATPKELEPLRVIEPKLGTQEIGQYKLKEGGLNTPYGTPEVFSKVKMTKIGDFKGDQWFSEKDTVDKYIKRIQAGEPIAPIIIKDGKIIDGFHRLEALTKLGHKEVPTVFVEEDLSAVKKAWAKEYPGHPFDMKEYLRETPSTKYPGYTQATKGVKELEPTFKLKTPPPPKAEVVKAEKPTIEKKIDIIEKGKEAEIQAKILLELETAQKGERFHWEDRDGTPHTIGVDTSFPKWVPENLRKRGLFDAVLKHIENDTIPIKADEVRLYNVVAEQLGLIEATKAVAKEEEIDVSKIFADEKTNEQISKVGRGEEAEVGKDIAGSIEKEKGIIEDRELVQILRGTKGMTADDIMKKHPDIKLTRDVPAKDVHGNKIEIDKGEVLTPYELKDGKILLQD